MLNILFNILILGVFFAPYKYFGQDNVNAILFSIISIAALISIKKIKGNKLYGTFLIAMGAVSAASLGLTSLTIDSMQGVSIYLSIIILYYLFTSYKHKEEEILNVLTYGLTVNAIMYIIYQGAVLKGGILQGRIDGNIGYANTYALLMIVGIYINKIRQSDKLHDIIDIIFVAGVLFTGSRNTLLYLGIFIILNVILIKKNDGIWDFREVFNCCMGGILYIVVGKFEMAAVFILPIVLIIYCFFFRDIKQKLINIITLAAIPIGVVVLFLGSSGMSKRLMSMSLNSNELQLRIGYLEDVIRYIAKHPLGAGINTYMYNQGEFQTGYYDIRYVHNAFGQVLYDMGVIGLCVFACMFIVGAIVIYKGQNKKKYYYLGLYISLYCHSLLDFNFAYLCIPTVIVMIAAFAGEVDSEVNLKAGLCTISFAAIGLYLAFISIYAYIGQTELKKGNYINAIHLGEIVDKYTIGDNSCKELQFKSYRNLYYDTSDEAYLKTGIKIIEDVEGSKHRKSYIYSELASGYGILGDVIKASEYYEKNIMLQKHCRYVYDQYCNMLKNQEMETGISYQEEINNIMNKYNEIYANRSEKSKKRFIE